MARLFNGTSDFVQMGGTVRGNDLRGVMVAAWVYPTSVVAGGSIVARWNTGVTEQWLLQLAAGGAIIGATLDTGFSGHVVTSAATLTVNTWAHVGLIAANNTSLQVYVNGVASGAATNPGALNQNNVESQPVFIGKAAGGNFYPGRVAEVVVSVVNTNLSSVATYAEVMAQLAAGVSPYEACAVIQTSELIRYYALLGDSPEPDYAGHAVTSSVTGTTVADGPPARTVSFGLAGVT